MAKPKPTAALRQGVFAYFTRHGTAANLLLVLMIAAGIAAFPNMRAQFFPDVVLNAVDVNIDWPGAGADDVDLAIVELVEPAVITIDGVESTSARAQEGSAVINVNFEAGHDMSQAVEDVQLVVGRITNLPEDAEEPRIWRRAWRDRVTDVVVTGPVGVDQLARFTDEFVLQLFGAGVTRTSIRGIAAPRILIEVETATLIRNDVTLRDIADAIGAEVDGAPAGDVTGANARVRTGVSKRSAEEIAGIVLRSDDAGSQLTVGDIAQIVVEGVDRDRSYFVGDNPAISIRVDRDALGDALEIQATVAEVAEQVMQGLPNGVTIDLIRTRSEAISGRLNVLIENALMGLGLVVVLLFLFLNARTAFWVAAGIPVAMFAAVAVMFAAGLTINMISLFALLITLGIVVDDAIVVGEHADFRVRRLGEPPDVAAATAARRMAGPVFSATVTTIIAFSGLMVIEGRFGELIADIPFTVMAVLLASLVECFLILPNHMSHSLAASQRNAWYDWPSRQVNKGFSRVRDHLFRPFIALVIRARYPVVAGLCVLLALQVAQVVRGDVQWRFFSGPEEGSVSGNFAMAPSATREDSLAQMRALQTIVEQLGVEYEAEFGRNPVAYALSEIGGNTGRGLSGTDSKEPYQLGSIAVELIDPDLRPYTSAKFVRDMQDRVERHPLTETLSFRRWRSGPGGDALDIQLYGADTNVLKAAAERLKDDLSQFGEVSALEDSLAYDKDELILDLTPQGAALGFTIESLGRTLRNRLNGVEAATYPVGTRTAEIRVQMPERELTADFLDRTLLRTPDGAYVPLADIVTVDRRSGFSTINRTNGLRVVTVNGDIADEDAARAQAIMDSLQDSILPRLEEEFGVATQLSGLAEQERDFLSDAVIGYGFCLMGIYLTLAWVFSSWTRPLLIMAVIPFGLIGTIYGHAAWGLPLSMFTVVGLIGMSGIIINDSIVLVTTIDEYSEQKALLPAIVDGTADRLRPVLLTTLTTVIGLMPLLYEPSRQAQFLKPTVITLVYGLGFGVVLVLMVVPALLAMQKDVQTQVTAFRRALAASQRGGGIYVLTLGATVTCAALFAATFGHLLVFGTLWAPLAALLPGDPGPWSAFALFTLGSGAIALGAFLLGALGFGLSTVTKRPG